MEGSSIVIHSAHPNLEPKDKHGVTEEEAVIPAMKGIESILDACKEHKVQRLFVILCAVNVIGDVFKHSKGDKVYTDKDIAPIEKDTLPGPLSKLKVEKAIIEFLENQAKTTEEH